MTKYMRAELKKSDNKTNKSKQLYDISTAPIFQIGLNYDRLFKLPKPRAPSNF